MKKLLLILSTLICFSAFGQDSLSNPLPISPITRNFIIDKGLQVNDTLLTKGRMMFQLLQGVGTRMVTADANGYLGVQAVGTSSNGLTERNDSSLLGGSLIEPTLIDLGAHNLNFLTVADTFQMALNDTATTGQKFQLLALKNSNLAIVNFNAYGSTWQHQYNDGRTATLSIDTNIAEITCEEGNYRYGVGGYNYNGLHTAKTHLYDIANNRDVSGIFCELGRQLIYHSPLTADADNRMQMIYFDTTAGIRLMDKYNYLDSTYKSKIQVVDTTFTLHLKASDTDYTVWSASNAGAILKTRLANDSTQQIQDATSLRWLIREGATNNSFIADNNGFAFSMTTGDFDIGTTTGGLLPPRMTATQASALTPSDGMKLYVTDTDATFTRIGEWIYDNGTWRQPHNRMQMGELYSETETTITGSDATKTLVNNIDSLSLNSVGDWDNPSNGRLRYTGTNTLMFHTGYTISMATTGGNNQQIEVEMRKSGTKIFGSKVLLTSDVSEYVSTAIHVFAEMATNDYLEVFVINNSGTNNVIVNSFNLFTMSVE